MNERRRLLVVVYVTTMCLGFAPATGAYRQNRSYSRDVIGKREHTSWCIMLALLFVQLMVSVWFLCPDIKRLGGGRTSSLAPCDTTLIL